MSDEITTEAPESSVAPETQGEGSPQTEATPSPEPAPQEATPNYWGAIRSLPDFHGQDERAVAYGVYQAIEREKAATQQLNQYREVMPHAQEYLSNRKEFEAWKQSQAQQQQLQQTQKQEEERWWKLPPLKDSYKKWLVTDPNGQQSIHPDAPIDARQAIQEQHDYKADFARRFMESPEETLGPMIAQMAANQASELFEQKHKEDVDQMMVNSITEANRDWLFEPGTENPTETGMLVHKYIEEAVEKGLQGPQDRWEYARMRLENDLAFKEISSLREQLQQMRVPPPSEPAPVAPPPAAAPPAQAADPAKDNMEYLRREASRRPSRSAGAASSDPRLAASGKSFADMLKETASSRGLI